MIPIAKSIALAGTVAVLVLMPGHGRADNRPAEGKDWPCVQPKIPELSVGMVWAGPPADADDRSWQESKDISTLVEKIAPRRVSLDEANTAIDAFAATLGPDKAQQITRVFVGLFQTINAERDEVMAGIERYSRKQFALADKIKAMTGELDRLRRADTLSDKDRAHLADLEEQLNWDTRVFDERAQSLTYVCESPVLLEQRLFALSRHLMSQLE
jgi:hypothetical protein